MKNIKCQTRLTWNTAKSLSIRDDFTFYRRVTAAAAIPSAGRVAWESLHDKTKKEVRLYISSRDPGRFETASPPSICRSVIGSFPPLTERAQKCQVGEGETRTLETAVSFLSSLQFIVFFCLSSQNRRFSNQTSGKKEFSHILKETFVKYDDNSA